jgi:hypothetical protein
LVKAVESGNPYNFRVPVQGPAAFFGRADQLQFVTECIQRKEHVSLVGEPGSGLTSLLKRLLAQDISIQCEAASGPLQFLSVDCTLFDSPLPLLRYLWLQVAPSRPVPALPDWRPLHSRFMGAVRGIGLKRLVVLFDDFETLGCNDLFVDWLESLRGLAIEREMSLIVATHRDLHACCHRDIVSSPFPNIFKVRAVGPFSPEESLEFVRGTSTLSKIDLEPYYAQITSLAGRVPYYLKMACFLYYRTLAQEQVPDHGKIAEQFLFEARPGFQRIWDRLSTDEQRILSDLASGKPIRVDPECTLATKGYWDRGSIFCTAFGDYVRSVSNQRA